ncbi:bifunctional 4-hydroxy-2-oxoglutarate aldolase/2-dehydro-3-deoxy-phosphogluconate aldolase [Enterovibrio calviensis]|uniref:bifunctional 4-hydroxy-2-oxoglutarate aldolase/2-dehydro-3-deoxy-phosphogluconate aldolase n=1 Tax=Enterovibrio calviensis TaxID=91359 RepID=UPI000686972C|nr:hypothetical protein [Enterovibrio calviensis]
MIVDKANVVSAIKDEKVFAIIRGIPAHNMIPLVDALIEGGIKVLEVTFPHDGSPSETLRSVSMIADTYGEQVYCGVGTVTQPEQVYAAKEAGACFVVSPNTDSAVIQASNDQGLVSIPGALTPTEVIEAHQAGADFVKLFPGGIFGASYLKAITGVLKNIPIIAVGGVTEANAASFFGAGACGIGIGGELVNPRIVEDKQFSLITEKAKALIAASNR